MGNMEGWLLAEILGLGVAVAHEMGNTAWALTKL